jgi:hypothetical protein
MKTSVPGVDRAVASFRGVDLGDARLTDRLESTVARIARSPSVPLPEALETDAAVQGAYRLMNNRRVNFDVLIAVQAEMTRQRAEEAGDVLVIHDTSDCSFATLDPEELGYLNTGKAGFRFHASLVVDGQAWRRPLGIVAGETIHRPRGRKRKGAGGPETAQWKDKEFGRWSRGLDASSAVLAGCRSVIHLADRESDSYDLMQRAVAAKQRFVFRVRIADRRGRSPTSTSGKWSTVAEVANGVKGVVQREVPLSARQAKSTPRSQRAHPARNFRTATLRFAATPIVLPRPQYLHEPVPATQALHLVHVFEVDVPEGEVPVEWFLYTTEPIASADDIARIVDLYRTRWLIEEFFQAMKSGCAFEKREFESRHALLNMLALTLPIACEVLALRSYARTNDATPARAVLRPVQLEILRTHGHYRLSENPTASEALLAVAAMGGHLKRNGAPGWTVLSRGMTKLMTHEAAQPLDNGNDDLEM